MKRYFIQSPDTWENLCDVIHLQKQLGIIGRHVFYTFRNFYACTSRHNADCRQKNRLQNPVGADLRFGEAG
jgi:hypothetical protein